MGKTFWAFTFICLLLLTMLTWSFSRLFSGEFLVNVLRDNNAYNRLLDNPSVYQDLEMGNLSQEQVKTILAKAIPAETFYSFLQQYFDSYADWFTGRVNELNFSYDLSATRQKARDALVETTLSSYNNLPDCQTAQLKSWSFEEGLPACRLANTSSSSADIARLASQQAETTLSFLPEKIEVKNPAQLVLARSAISRLFWGFWALWAVTAIWLLLFLVVQRRKALVTLGASLIISGLIAISFSFFLWDWLATTIIDFLAGSITINELLPLANDLARQLTDTIKNNMGFYAVVSIVLGLGSFMLAVIFRRRHQLQQKIELN